MYVVNKGQFSSMMTLIAFYANLSVLIIFNIIVNSNTDYKSAKTWIGKEQTDIIGILLKKIEQVPF